MGVCVCVCAHVTMNSVWIRWHRDRRVTVLLPLQGHKTSYDRDRKSSALMEDREERDEETDEGKLRSEREDRETHDSLCHWSLQSALQLRRTALWNHDDKTFSGASVYVYMYKNGLKTCLFITTILSSEYEQETRTMFCCPQWNSDDTRASWTDHQSVRRLRLTWSLICTFLTWKRKT